MLTTIEFNSLKKKVQEYFNHLLPSAFNYFAYNSLKELEVKSLRMEVENMHLQQHIDTLMYTRKELVSQYQHDSCIRYLYQLVSDGSKLVLESESVPINWKHATLDAFVNWNKIEFINAYLKPKVKYRVIQKTLLKKLFIPPFPIEAGNNTLYMNYLVSEGVNQ